MIKHYLSRGGVFRYAALMACLLWLAGSQHTVLAVNLISSSYSALPAGAGEECAEIDDEALCLSDDLNADSGNRTVDEADEDCADEGGDIGSGLVSVTIRLIKGDEGIFIGNDFVEPGVEIREDGVAVDTVFNALDDDGGFNKDVANTYWFEYEVTHLGVTRSDYRRVHVIGITPKLLNGGTEKYIHQGGSFVDAGTFFTFSAQYANSLVMSDDTVDPNVVGAYPLTYNTPADDQGNVYTVTYTVHVTDQPILEPIGVHPYFVSPGNDFNDPGAKLIDVNGNILDTIYAGSPLTVSGANKYEEVEYSYTDGGSYSTTITRMIYVPYFDLDVSHLLYDYPYAFLPKDISLNLSFAGKSPSFFYKNERDEEIVLKEITNVSELKSNHNPSVPGDYKVWFEYVDSQGDTLIYEEEFKVAESPALEFDIPNPFYFTKGKTNWSPTSTSGYILKAYLKSNGTVIGNPDGTWMNPSYWSNQINFNSEGTYNYMYAVKDINDNSISTTMTVHIVEPKFYLPNDTTIAVGSSYTFPDVRVTGTIAGSLLDTFAVKPTTTSGWQNTAGLYEYEYTFTDSRGNTSTSAKFTVTVGSGDTTPPADPVVTTTVISPANPVIQGTWDFDDIDSVQILLFSNGIDITIEDKNSVQVNVGDNDAWLLNLDSVKASLFDGDVIYMDFYVFDNAGNQGNASEVEIAIDAAPPADPVVTTTVISPANPVIQGTWDFDDIAEFEFGIYDDNGGIDFEVERLGDTLSTDGTSWEIDLSPWSADLVEGNTIELYVILKDALVNSTGWLDFEVEPDLTPPPAPTITEVKVKKQVSGFISTTIKGKFDTLQTHLLKIKIEKEDGGELTDDYLVGSNVNIIDDEWIVIKGASNLPQGTHRFKIKALDEVSNESAETDVEIDRVPPAAPAVDSLLTNNPKPTITGTFTREIGGSLQVVIPISPSDTIDYTDSDSELTASVSGTWSLDLSSRASDLPDGTYNVQAIYYDQTGNSAIDITDSELTIDTQPPPKPIFDVVEDTIVITSVPYEITGTWLEEEVDIMKILILTYEYTFADDQLEDLGGGRWKLTVNGLIPSRLGDSNFTHDGTFTLGSVVWDEAGNASASYSADRLFVSYDINPPATPTVDAQPPLQPGGLAITGTWENDPGNHTLTVEVNGTVYTKDSTQLTTPGDTWTLSFPEGLPEGIYDVIVETVDRFGRVASDTSTDEIVVSPDQDSDGATNHEDSDDDGDGLLDVNEISDERRLIAHTASDTILIYRGETKTINILDNDDFSPQNPGGVSITAINPMLPSSNIGTATLDNSTGEMTFTSKNLHLTTIEFRYEVCATSLGDIGGACVVDTVFLVPLGSAPDTDGDGMQDWEDDDIDGDGIPNDEDADPLTLATVQNDTAYIVPGTNIIHYDVLANDEFVKGVGTQLCWSGSLPHADIEEIARVPERDLKVNFYHDQVTLGEVYTIPFEVCGVRDSTATHDAQCADPLKRCANSTLTIFVVSDTQDDDGDGHPNVNDPNPGKPFAAGEDFTIPFGETSYLDVLANDDFVAGKSLTSVVVQGGTAPGAIASDNTGITYLPLFSEVGEVVTIDYMPCYGSGATLVCGNTVTATITVTGLPDTDGDGDPDITDPDDDNDGNPDGTDPNPLVAHTQRDIMYPAAELFVITAEDVLANDDFAPSEFTKLEILPTGSAVGEAVLGLDANGYPDGFIKYDAEESEVGDTVEVHYRVCNTAVTPEACGIDTLEIPVIAPLDTDGDGNPDETDPDKGNATARDDFFTIPFNTIVSLDILENDDFLPQTNTSARIISAAIVGSDIPLDALSVIYTILPGSEKMAVRFNEVAYNTGALLVIDYEVCHAIDDTVTPVCDTAYVGIDVMGEQDGYWIKNTNGEVHHWNNVGINTDDPAYNLEVNGTTKTDHFRVGSTDDHPVVEIDGDSHRMILDGHLQLSDPDNPGEEDRWSAKYDDYLLWIEGGLVADDMAFAEPDEWADYVFEEDYELPTIEEIEEHIKAKGHLHTMPSEAEVKADGYSAQDMNKRLLQTIEELTLHIIEQEKKAKGQQQLLEKSLERLKMLENRSND